jgi:PsbN protein
MEMSTIFIVFISSLLLGVTGYSIYSSFGPGSKLLSDPFLEHED